jgi:hypothetical protein
MAEKPQGDGSMIRSFALTAAAAALTTAPLAAQATPPRAPAPVSTESESLGGSPLLVILAIALVVGVIILATTSGDDPVSP